MASRWAFEAIAVSQFKYNDYERWVFDAEKQISDAVFEVNLKLPKLMEVCNNCLLSLTDSSQSEGFKKSYSEDLQLLKNEISAYQSTYNHQFSLDISNLKPSTANIAQLNQILFF